MSGRVAFHASAPPSTRGSGTWHRAAGLRKWFDHDPSRFSEFRARYREELAAQHEILGELRHRAAEGTVTILYAARDREHNNGVVVAELLGEK